MMWLFAIEEEEQRRPERANKPSICFSESPEKCF